jgi:hypothetical protein
MSEENKTQEKQSTPEEKIELMKTIFMSLEIDNRAVFTDWCHENVKSGGTEYFRNKMQKMNDDLSKMVANFSDKVGDVGSKIYNNTNEAFKGVTGSQDNSGKSDIFD